MKIRYQKFSVAVSLLLVVALGQAYVSIGLAASDASPRVTEVTPQIIMGTLTTGGNKPIKVNGANAVSGATIPSGATIETPDDAGATIRLGALGSICIAKNTKVTLEFDGQGKVIKVTLSAGCIILNTAKGTTGTMVTPQGTSQQMGPDTASTIDVCSKAGQSPVLNQGAALDAGAGASIADCGIAPAPAAVTDGFPLKATLGIIAFGATGLLLLFNGGNPSPSGP